MRIAIVGNGPSAAGMGAEIDAHDFVVRCNFFVLKGAADAGKKLSAWAWFGEKASAAITGGTPAGEYDVWFAWPVVENYANDPLCSSLLWRATEAAGGRKMKFIPADLWYRMVRALGGKHPTVGFIAVALAIEKKPAELSLYGFDSTTPDRDGWEDAGFHNAGCPPVPKASTNHDFFLEKKLLADLFLRGTWLGEKCEARINWPAMPAVLKET